LPSRRPPFFWLLEKECRELRVSRAWWLLLLAMGPLVGVSFISAVRTYAEVSGLNGTSAGVGEALSPLVGVWAPTFSACELVAVFLLPFVAIRLVSGDRQSGALKLELQQGMPPLARVAVKTLVLLAGWIIAMLPPLSAILLWKSYGGSVYTPELATLVLGHVLNAGLTIALAAAMSSLTEHPSTAAILTLGVTVGTWIVNFFGAVQGGWWERASGYTPAAMVAEFQHGLLRLDTTLAAIVLIGAGLSFAAVWMRLGLQVKRRVYESAAILVLAAAGLAACTAANASWDTSEARSNSFPEADERALARIHELLTVEVHLAPEDPRRVDLEHRALSKLRRVMPDVRVRYVSATSIGLFEQTGAGYGEIWYDLSGRKTMSRVTTAEGVLEAVYSLAGIKPPAENDDAAFRGHPLAAPPARAGTIFYGFWPGVFLAGAIFTRKRLR
jgi:ABC-2 type transport system permease protein